MTPLALSASMAFAQASAGEVASMSIDQLKQLYLECDRVASSERLDTGTAVVCSLVSEALKKRAFDGSFERLLAWWRAEKDAASAREGKNQ